MPAHRKTKSDKQRDQFLRMYAAGKAHTRLTDAEVAECIGVSPNTMTARKKDPMKFSLGEIAKLAIVMQWDTTDIAKLMIM